MKKIVLITLALAATLATKAQVKFWVFFTDKPHAESFIQAPERMLSERALMRRQRQDIALNITDVPVSTTYIKALKNEGVVVLTQSKWLNAVSIFATQQQLESIQNLSFIKTIKPVLNMGRAQELIEETSIFKTFTAQPYSYGNSWNQISMLAGNVLHDNNLRGQNMLIAVLDGGFTEAQNISAFDSLWARNGIIATHDFVDGDTNVFERGSHGTSVLSVMAGFVDGQMVGSAPKANYILLQSEDQSSETTIEEDNWVRAAEFADSVGADLINSSLGYYTFDGGIGDYTYADLDGRTGITTIAAIMAARKGILVVNSAGNEGSSAWKYIITPADADSILAVGGVDENGIRVNFSSHGPTADGRIKPDVCAKAQNVTLINVFGNVATSNGTSFSSPLITGLAACLWQNHPNRTAMQVRSAIMQSASMYTNPDTLMGYGIPNFALADVYLTFLDNEAFQPDLQEVDLLPNPFLDVVSLRVKLPRYPEHAHLVIMDSSGKLVYKTALEINSEITAIGGLDVLPSGLYIFSVTIGGKAYQFKMVR
jgi:hypothetical protein